MHTTLRILLFLALGALAGSLAAQPITLAGNVVAGNGEPASGLEIRLLPILPAYEAAKRDLAGGEIAAVAEALTGIDGSFQLVAPAGGFWRVVATAPGRVSMTFAFDGEPLLESTTLPTLELGSAEPVAVEVLYPDGSPAPGAWIRTREKERPRRLRRWGRWVAYRPAIEADAAGRATVFASLDSTLAFVAWLPTHVTAEKTTAMAGRARLRLGAATPRRLLLVDSADRPASDVVVQVSGMRWPAAASDREGHATIHALEATRVTLVVPDGRAIPVQLEAEEGIESPFPITVPEPLRAGGRVLDGSDRRAVSGAFVFPAGDTGRTVRTGPDGAFQLLVGESDHSLTAAAVGYLPQTERLGLAGASRSLVLQRATNLTGRVLDSAGNPVSQAQVHAGIYFGGVSRSFTQPERHARSNADGDFALTGLASEGSYRITARKGGFAPAEEIVRHPQDRELQGGLTLILEPGTGVTGRLVDVDGVGVAGAAVEMRRDQRHRMVVYDPALEDVFAFQTASNPAGRFSISHAPAGRFSLTVEAPGHARMDMLGLQLGEGEANLDVGTITLEPGVSLRGRIVDPDGVPLAAARIRLEKRHAGLGRFSFGTRDEPHAVSGVDGLFMVADRRQGELLTLHVERDGYADREVPGVKIEPAAILDVVLQPAVNVRGRVVSPEGEPVNGAQVMLAPEGGSSSYGDRVSSRWTHGDRTDELGRFELDDVEPGKVRLGAQAEGWLSVEVGDLELLAGHDREDVELRLRSGASIEGRVIGADGAPVSEAFVSVEQPSSFRQRASARTDGDGAYRLGGIEPGRRTVLVYAPDGSQMAKALTVEPGANSLDFYLEGGVEVSGRVLTLRGAAVESALVQLDSADASSGNKRAHSEADGSFRIPNVRAGSFRVFVFHPDYATTVVEEPLEIEQQPVLGFEIRLSEGGDLVGRITGLDPEDFLDTQVAAFSLPANYQEGFVDSEGAYRIENLAPGTWRAFARTSEGRQAVGSVEISEGDAEVVLDLDFRQGLSLTGRVLRHGRPLAGLQVALAGIDVGESASAQTNYEGRFVLEGLEAGLYRLHLTDSDSGLAYSEEVELRRDDAIEIELEGSTISGLIVSRRDNNPLTGAMVVLEPDVDPAKPSSPTSVARGTTSDDNGRFSLTEILPGTYRLRVSKDGFAARAQRVSVKPGDDLEGLDFSLAPVEGIGLQVFLPSGAPARVIDYAVFDVTGNALLGGREVATSEGQIHLATVPDGEWTIMLATSGAAVHELRSTAPRERIVVRLDSGAHLSVQVEELRGEPTAAASLRIRSETGEPFKDLDWSGVVRREWPLFGGRVEVDGLSPGRWLLSISTADGRSWEDSVRLVAGHNDEVVVD